MNKTSGETATILMLVIAILGGAFLVLKPKAFHGESRRAEQSSKTTEELLKATEKQGAVAAASVVKIAEANAESTPSPQKSFIGQESQVALANLPAPDAQALIEAERRKNAVLTGRLEEASALYGNAMQKADTLQRELAAAIEAKRRSDLELQRIAAEHLGAERQQNLMYIVIGVLVLLWAYTKLSHVSPLQLSRAANDIRYGSGEQSSAIQALDTATTPLQQFMVKAHAKVGRAIHKITEPDTR